MSGSCQSEFGGDGSWIPCGETGAAGLARALETVSGWARGYARSLSDRDVRDPSVGFGDVLGAMDEEPPIEGVSIGALGGLIEEADRAFVSRLVHWQSPRFFAYFPCSSSTPGIVGEVMSAVVNVNGMLWSASPACTELEMRVMDWCARLHGIDDAFTFVRSETGGGCIQGTASEGAVAALCAARRRCTRRGKDRGDVCVYASTQAHSSIVKSAMVCGLADDAEDRSRVRLIGTGPDLRMDPEALRDAIRRDLDDGLVPAMVVVSVGTTSTGAVDDLRAVVGVVESFGVEAPWVHVDAAWAGSACVVERYRGMLDGHERADSICINPHKWLLTNFDCDLFWVRDRGALTDSMAITPAYLRDRASESGAVDYRDWHVPLGRRMRALKLWFVIRCFGARGLAAHIERHVGLARRVECWVRDRAELEMVGERSLGLVCFRVRGDDELSAALVERVNARGRVMITHSRVPIGEGGAERSIVRVSVGTPGVDDSAVDELLSELDLGLGTVLGDVFGGAVD